MELGHQRFIFRYAGSPDVQDHIIKGDTETEITTEDRSICIDGDVIEKRLVDAVRTARGGVIENVDASDIHGVGCAADPDGVMTTR